MRQNQPGGKNDENGQCEEDKLPRTEPKVMCLLYGLKLKVTFTVASLPLLFASERLSTN
jgi:hypothetical protein